MTYGIDVAGSDIRWVSLARDIPTGGSPRFGRVEIQDESSPSAFRKAAKELFRTLRVHRYTFPVYGPDVRAKFYPSDKVDISELADHVSWEARFMLDYDWRNDELSYDPMRSVANQTWIVAAAASNNTVKRFCDLLPESPLYVDCALTALANAVLESKWSKTDLKILHLDRSRAFLVIVIHGDPVLMQEIPVANLTDIKLDENQLSVWQEELKLRRNFLAPDKRSIDKFLLSGEAALYPENVTNLGERLELDSEVFNPFDGEVADESAPLYTLAYACALRGAR